TISSRWGAILRGRAPNPASSTRLATREWTCAKSLPKPFYVACYVAEPISESSFLRRKVARGFAVPRHKPDSASASLDVGMSQSSTVDGVAAGSRHAVTTFADQFFTNAPKRPSALE